MLHEVLHGFLGPHKTESDYEPPEANEGVMNNNPNSILFNPFLDDYPLTQRQLRMIQQNGLWR